MLLATLGVLAFSHAVYVLISAAVFATRRGQ
jgi:hypothetical protein